VSTPARRKRGAEGALAFVDDLGEPFAEARVVRVDVQKPLRSPSPHGHEPDVRQLALARVRETDRERLVPPREETERLFPAGRVKKSRR